MFLDKSSREESRQTEEDKNLNKFLTDSSETTSMQQKKDQPLDQSNSLAPICSERGGKRSKPNSVHNDKTLSNLGSKLSGSVDENDGKSC